MPTWKPRGTMRRLSLSLITVVAWLLPVADANAKIAFAWSVPELLGTGTNGVARSVAEAARAQPTDILLQACAPDAKWSLDGKDVKPVATGRCQFRLDLGDHAEHKLELSAGGESVEQQVQARYLVIVSIGDSVASGEGNPDVSNPLEPGWLEPRCHRSMRSGAAQAADAIATSDPHTAVVFLPLACSGASVPEGLLGSFEGVQPNRSLGPLPPQLDQLEALERARQIDAVLLSVGANDVYFGPLVRFCVVAQPCPKRRFDPAHPEREAADRDTPSAEAVHAKAQSMLPSHYRELAERLQRMKQLDPDRVIIVEYFDPTHNERGETCKRLLPKVTPDETEWAQADLLNPLNAAVREAARRYKWQLVAGVQKAFLEHGICASGSMSWVRTWNASIGRGARLSGTLHPDSAGHLATASLIAPVLANVVGVDPGGAVAQTSGAGDDEGTGVAWWWLTVAALLGAGLALAIELGIRHK
jgi:lysophospholipase L1-like esterase